MPSSPERSAAQAVAVGWARVREGWRQVGAAYLLSLLLTLPLAAALRASLAQSVRHREAAQRLLESWDGLWHASFSAHARGLDATFDAGVVGIGAVLRSLDTLLRGATFDLPAPLVVVGMLYLLGWVLLSGGLLARFGGDERGLVRLGALHFRRMLSLAVVGWALWAAVMAWLLPTLGAWVEQMTRDVIDERIQAAWVLGKYLVLWTLMVVIRVLIDYAKVFAIEEPGISTAVALARSLELLRRRPGAVLGVTLRLGAIGLALLLAYWVFAPGADQANPFKILIAFLISQTSVVARVTMRAWGLSSAQALALREP